MTLDQFDTFVGTVLLIYAGLVLLAGVAKFLSRHHVPSVLHSTAEPASRAAEVDVVDVRTVRTDHTRQPIGRATADEPRAYSGAERTTATEDSGGEVAVPASGRIGPTPDALLTTSRSREDPAVLGRDRAQPWSW